MPSGYDEESGTAEIRKVLQRYGVDNDETLNAMSIEIANVRRLMPEVKYPPRPKLNTKENEIDLLSYYRVDLMFSGSVEINGVEDGFYVSGSVDGLSLLKALNELNHPTNRGEE